MIVHRVRQTGRDPVKNGIQFGFPVKKKARDRDPGGKPSTNPVWAQARAARVLITPWIEYFSSNIANARIVRTRRTEVDIYSDVVDRSTARIVARVAPESIVARSPGESPSRTIRRLARLWAS